MSATLGGERRWMARMSAVAELGRAALSGLDADALVDEALRLVATVLEGAQVGVLEQVAGTPDLRVRAAVGWRAPVAGTTVPGKTGSLAGFTLLADEPVLVTDLATETRFTVPAIVTEHAAASAVSAVMRGPQGPVGVLCVFSPVAGKFSEEDVAFLRIVANTLAAALGRAALDHEVRRTGALLQEVVGGATDAIFVKDLEGRFLLINDAGAQVLGRPREEIIGLRTQDVFPAAIAAGIEEGESAVLARGEWLTYEDRVVTGAGQARTFLSTKGPYRDPDGNVIGLIGIARDITERKDAEDRQRLLAASGRLLATQLDEAGTLAEVVALPLPALADWCAVHLLHPSGRVARAAAAHVEPAFDPGSIPDSPLISDVLATSSGRVEQDGDQSLVVVPLVSRGRLLGTLSIGSGARRRYSAADLDAFSELGLRVALAIENARLFRDRELVARTLQESLLPLELPDVPGLELAARYHAGGEGLEVGGDFYDVFRTGDGWSVVMGDVCGRGPAAAAVTALARHTLRAIGTREDEPRQLLDALNDALLDHPAPFCTAALAHLRTDAEGAEMTIACGGHPAPIVLRASGVAEAVPAHGTVIGAIPDLELELAHVRLNHGDALVLYTDGLVEVRAGKSDWSIERLRQTLEAWAGLDAETLAARLVAVALEAHGGAITDDLAFLVVRAVEA